MWWIGECVMGGGGIGECDGWGVICCGYLSVMGGGWDVVDR